MHKIILWCFKNLDNVAQLCSFCCAFFILTTLLYWLETIINAQWNWLNFIKPVLNNILNIANDIFPFSFDAFGTTFDGKFITAVISLSIIMWLCRCFINSLANLKDSYDIVHVKHKKNIEKSFNKKMYDQIKQEEVKITKYMVLINTQLKKKFSHKEININIDLQNKLTNDFISEKTGVTHQNFNGGFLYYFDNFDKIDNVLDILFKLIKSSFPIDYAISVQVGLDLNLIKKLSELKQYNKIVFCADTLLRYKYNESHRYGTENVGIFQNKGNSNTIEVHEFTEIL